MAEYTYKYFVDAVQDCSYILCDEWILHGFFSPSLYMQSHGRPSTEQIVREVPMATSDKPVTMPVKPRQMASKKLSMEREISPDSIVRSSSSSYHSASNYDEPDEHNSSTHYSYNVEHGVPHTLVQSKGPVGSSMKRQQPGHHVSQHSSGHIISDCPSNQATPKQLQGLFSHSTGSGNRPTASTKHASAGMGALHDGEMSLLLVHGFRDAVKAWNNEAVEIVLMKNEQVVDTVFTTEVINVLCMLSKL